jgi:arylsulfatase A
MMGGSFCPGGTPENRPEFQSWAILADASGPLRAPSVCGAGKAIPSRLLLLSALLLSLALPLSARAATPPNIIIILADDMGYGDLSCYGNPGTRTPNLDKMAAEGLKFTDFYVAASVCTPSRAGLLTGRLPIRSGMAGSPKNSVLMTDSTGGLPTNEITIAAALKPKGYATACIGKWHLGYQPEFLPTHHGFDYFYGVRFANNMEPAKGVRRPKQPLASLNPKREWWHMALLRNTEVIEPDTDPYTLTARYTAEALQFIKAHRQQPFFLYFAHTYPHAPLFASEKFQKRSARGLYGDVVEELDWSVGEVLKTLQEQGLATNTFVFFTSDNGPAVSLKLAGGSAGPLRGGKGSAWEGGLREPAIAWWPGQIPAGVVTHQLACSLDLFNTSAGLAGVPMPTDRPMDGVDLAPVLLQGEPSARNVLFYYHRDHLWAVRKGSFKAHFAVLPGDPAESTFNHPPPYLFQVQNDPGEQLDLAAEYPEVLADLRHEFEQHQQNTVPGKSQY